VKSRVTLHVNGEQHELLVAPHHTLLEILREDLHLTGTKHGCELGECGACAVLVDGEAVLSCLTLVGDVQGQPITTIEGLADGQTLDPLQHLFAELGGSQCGYCTSGMVLTSRALLDQTPDPTEAQVQEALSGNICRCTGYNQIVEAVLEAARRERAGENTP
jgi:carbon-monoxide dehydrogenase small subunit